VKPLTFKEKPESKDSSMTPEKFDPNAASLSDSGIFGLPFDEKSSQVIYLPIPWEATTSYGGGTSEGPKAIEMSSKQVDLYDTDVLNPYAVGLYMLPESQEVRQWNHQAKTQAQKVIEASGIVEGNPELIEALATVNHLGTQLNGWVNEQTQRVLKSEKIVGIIGGDHSVPFGALQAISKHYPSFGILHFDAHSDTRQAYEGFEWSHASIMYNVLEHIPSVSQLVQVGIRDVCEEEMNYCASQKDRVHVFLDRDLQRKKYQGSTWDQICQEIIQTLPPHVWISFDIDGLDPRFCPHTGTPVPGGLDFQEANYLIGALVRSGRTIIGFDLNEVAPNLEQPSDEWDANVGARMLYKLTGWTLASQKKAKIL
jgi:agmatinase